MATEAGLAVRPEAWRCPHPLPLPIETERLVLRSYRAGDAEGVFAMVDRYRGELGEWLTWPRTDHADLDACRRKLAGFEAEALHPDSKGVVIAMYDRGSGEIVGGCGFGPYDREAWSTESGYWIRPDLWGRGLCVEAIGALFTRGLTERAGGGWGFRRLFVRCDARNVASRRVAEKLGLRLEERKKEEVWAERDDGWRTTLGYGVLASEWDFDAGRAKAGIGWGGAPFGRGA